MFKKGIILSFCVTLAGCSTAAIQAWDSKNINSVIGTENPSFILGYSELSVVTGVYDHEATREKYSMRICDWYNEDNELKKLYGEGLIENIPKCTGHNEYGSGLRVEVGTLKTKCFLGCLDIYIKYSDYNGNVLAYTEAKDFPYMEAIRYSIGHIKNMIIVANIQKNKDNPEWQARLKSVCKKEKGLKAFCG